MTEIPQDWQRLALDDGTVVEEAHSYQVVLESDTSPNRTVRPTSVRHTSDVNAANNFQVSVPPASFLEDETYLGSTAKIFVDGDILFQGELKKITIDERGVDDYQLKIYSQGRKLQGKTVDRTANNEVVYDTIALLADRYNAFDSDHETMVNGDSQSLSGAFIGGGDIIQTNSGSGSVTYSGVGGNVSDLELLRVKAYTPGTDDVTVTVSSSSNSYSQTFTDLDSNIYGEWGEVTPGSTFDGDSGSYDITFTVQGEALVINWIALTEVVIDREVVTPDVSVTDTNTSLYSYSGTELQDNMANTPDGQNETDYVVWDSSIGSDGGYRPRQVCEWHTKYADDPIGFGEPLASDGAALELPYTYGYEADFNPKDTIEDWGLYVRHTREPRVECFEDFSGWDTNSSTVSSPVASGSTALDKPDNVSEGESFDIVDCSQVTFEFSGEVYIPSSTTAVEMGFRNTLDEDIYGEVNVSNGTIEVYGPPGELATKSVSIPTDQYVSYTVRYYEGGLNNDDDIIEFDFGSNSVSSVAQAGSMRIEGAFVRDGAAYFDELLTVVNQFNGPAINWSVSFDGGTHELGTGSPGRNEMVWSQISGFDYGPNWSNAVDSDTFVVNLQDGGETSNKQRIDCSVLVHRESRWGSSDFSNTLTNDFLNKPHRFATREKVGNHQYVRFNDFVHDENISASTVNATMATPGDEIGKWGVQQRIDTDTPFDNDFANATSVTNDYSYPGVSHGTRVALTAAGAARNDDNPRLGYTHTTIEGFSVTVDANDLDVIFDRSLTNNRLSAASDVAGKSTAYFRFEGDKALIFKRGALKTSPNLREAEVQSSFTIEDTYASCEVIGLHNVRSGVIAAANPPSYVDEHREIRDQNIEIEADAVARAKSFLEENGTVQYEGSIDTLPTLAPVGSTIDGSFFSHGNDMIIKSVQYNKRTASIELGLQRDIVSQFVGLSTDTESTQSRETGEGMRIPSGSDNSA